MGKLLESAKKRIRFIVQIIWTALSNGYLAGFAGGKIYTGSIKALCVPGLNCYSCPGALGACPIGALQAVLGSNNFRFSYYIVGFLIFTGVIAGRFVCGWLCPFGLVQDLLHKIPFFRKRKNLPGHSGLKWMKYVILVVFVILMPMFVVDVIGQGSPAFCKYICPSGTLTAGIPLVASNSMLAMAAGALYKWKVAILIVTVLLSIWVYRPFCKYVCPLGAAYGLFHPVSLARIEVNRDKCIECGKCQNVCKMDIKVWETPNSMECIRCGDCIKACPVSALSKEFIFPGKKSGCKYVDEKGKE